MRKIIPIKDFSKTDKRPSSTGYSKGKVRDRVAFFVTTKKEEGRASSQLLLVAAGLELPG